MLNTPVRAFAHTSAGVSLTVIVALLVSVSSAEQPSTTVLNEYSIVKVLYGAPPQVLESSSDEQLGTLFQNYVRQYKKQYKTTSEYNRRFHAFADNMKYIQARHAAHATKDGSPTTVPVGLNEYADLTFAEFSAAYLMDDAAAVMGADEDGRLAFVRSGTSPAALPDEFDWDKKEAVSAVRAQGNCGSCWAFATVAAVESVYRIHRNESTDLSEQQMLDCATSARGYSQCNKCSGGYPPSAYKWVADHGVAARAEYPYACESKSAAKCTSTQCHEPASKKLFSKISGSKSAVGESSIKDALVNMNPGSVALTASRAMQLYTGEGVFVDDTGCAGESTNHVLVLVGYGTENGTKFWKIKNSWGKKWGRDGWLLMKRGVNMCRVESFGVFPYV